jgi:formylglycine-generating enzyme required for sulfatase activity
VRSTRIGWAVLAGLIAIVTAVLYDAGSRSATSTGPPSVALPAAVAGFRADAWFLPDDDLLGFVKVSAGPFVMGSDPAKDPQAFENERWSASAPQGTVDVGEFYIGRYEVTAVQFAAFAAATGHRADPQALRAAPRHPVAHVSWPDALAYCRWLEGMLKTGPAVPKELSRLVRDGWRVGLPSEAEWEKAARGTDGRIYPWGNEPRRDRANYAAAGVRDVGDVACPECPYGLSDMSGNVWEWTRSPYQPYPFDTADDDATLAADALWVMRGGHFGDQARNVRAALRGGADPGVRRPFIGFRIVMSRF